MKWTLIYCRYYLPCWIVIQTHISSTTPKTPENKKVPLLGGQRRGKDMNWTSIGNVEAIPTSRIKQAIKKNP